MTTDTNLSQIVFNRLSNEKYHELKTSGQLNDQQFYITPDLDTNPGLIQDYMSNCITKIPQHINLELSTDGTLTLKAGSVVYIPNGVGIFDEVITESDFSRDGKIWNGLGIITYQNGIDWAPLTNCVSSDTTPAEPKNGMLWYDTTNNIIKRYNGTDWFGTRSLPLAIFNSSAESTKLEIIQVFNGIGYMGAVAFAVPGVQAIIPNGFNNDGQLNNITATVERVVTKDYAADNILGQNLPLTLTNSPLLSAGDMIYAEEENQMYKGSISELNKRTEVEIAKVTTDSTRITSLTPLPIYNRILNSAQVYELDNKAVHKNIDEAIPNRKTFIDTPISNKELWLVDTTGEAPDNPPNQNNAYGTLRWIVKGTEGSTAAYGGGQEFFRIQPILTPEGNFVVNAIYLYGTTKPLLFNSGCDKDGNNVYFNVPTPATNDNSTKAATTAWVNTFADTSSAGKTGATYVKIGKLLIQFGNLKVSSAGTTVTLPRPFSNTAYKVVTTRSAGSINPSIANVGDLKTTSFPLYAGGTLSSDGTGSFYWIAIGEGA